MPPVSTHPACRLNIFKKVLWVNELLVVAPMTVIHIDIVRTPAPKVHARGVSPTHGLQPTTSLHVPLLIGPITFAIIQTNIQVVIFVHLQTFVIVLASDRLVSFVVVPVLLTPKPFSSATVLPLDVYVVRIDSEAITIGRELKGPMLLGRMTRKKTNGRHTFLLHSIVIAAFHFVDIIDDFNALVKVPVGLQP